MDTLPQNGTYRIQRSFRQAEGTIYANSYVAVQFQPDGSALASRRGLIVACRQDDLGPRDETGQLRPVPPRVVNLCEPDAVDLTDDASNFFGSTKDHKLLAAGRAARRSKHASTETAHNRCWFNPRRKQLRQPA